MSIAEVYGRHKNLKLAAEELGMKWQSLYVHLRKLGVSVTGDKARYGCAKDRLASYAERLFAQSVPGAIDANAEQFQASIDFSVFGWSVDVKAATPSADSTRWSFCVNKQKDRADFFVLYAFDASEQRKIEHILLIPIEIATTSKLISLPKTMNSKWADYEISEEDLPQFFQSLGAKQS